MNTNTYIRRCISLIMILALKNTKSITELKKGDKMKINGKELEVDAHFVLIDHGDTKEMAIELFDPKAKEDEGDYQLRYFSDNFERSLRFFILKSIMYDSVEIEKIEW